MFKSYIYSINDCIKSNKLKFLALSLFFVAILNLYFFIKYQISEPFIEKISLQSDIRPQDIVVYASSGDNSKIDFSKPIKPTIENNRFFFNLHQKIRSFRIYTGNSYDKATIGNMELHYQNKIQFLSINDFRLVEIFFSDKANPNILSFSCGLDAYFELKRECITQQEFIVSELLILVFGFLFSTLVLSAFPKLFDFKIGKANYKSVMACVFFASIFLPQPIFNGAFMLSFLLVVLNFNYKVFYRNKVALLFLLYFLMFIANNLFLSQSFNRQFTETMLPFFFLPFYFACLPRKDYLPVFIFTGFSVSLFFFFTSFINASLYHDLSYFSFDAFTKYVHPVYFSYLLFFCICYIELSSKLSFNKIITQIVLLFALIFCGSKLIIGLTVLLYASRFFRKKQILGWGVVAFSVVVVLLFPPTRKRFQQTFNLKSLGVLRENFVKSHDPRINDLTIRLIIWQESLASINSMKDFIFGKGVDKQANEFLEKRLANRGLEHGQTKYDQHNQFIATYYKMGIVGLIVLLCICFIILYSAIKNKNTLLFFTSILFISAMFTESLLQRVTGIYFFICILSLLSPSLKTSNYQIEDSNTRHKRNSE